MSIFDESTWGLVLRIGDIEIETKPEDSPEQISAAIRTAHELDELRTKAKHERLRLVRCDHPLKDFIEVAMAGAGATTFDETEAVWRQLVALASTDDAPKHVIGYSPSKRAIKYQGKEYDKSGQSDYFTRDALAQLFRRQKAYASQREPTAANTR